MKTIIALVVAITLTACASAPEALDPAKLVKVQQPSTLDVSQISLYDGQITLCAGEYKAELEDALGVFYRGPSNCFRHLNATYPGGIYITKPPAPVKYRAYYYMTSSEPADATNSVEIAQAAAPTAGPVATGAGAGIGAGIVTYMQHMNDGQLMLLQPVEGVDYARFVRASK